VIPRVEAPFPWAPLVAGGLFVVLAIWAYAARKKR
jgi:hypothetical protein